MIDENTAPENGNQVEANSTAEAQGSTSYPPVAGSCPYKNVSNSEERIRQKQQERDQRWAGANIDGRVHWSIREGYRKHAPQLRAAVHAYYTLVTLAQGLKQASSPLYVLTPPLLARIAEFSFPGHGPLMAHLADTKPRQVQRIANFQVTVRKRPLLPFEIEGGEFDSVGADPGTQQVVCHDGRLDRSGRRLTMTHHHAVFDRVWGGECGEELVFRQGVLPLVLNACAPGSRGSTLLCYGQTGTGKTHTMMGALRRTAGILAKERRHVEVVFFEIHGKKCYDLLSERRLVHLRADAQERVHVRGARKVRVDMSSPNKFLEVLQSALDLRSVRVTERNPISSRSHAVCEIRIFQPSSKAPATNPVTCEAFGDASNGQPSPAKFASVQSVSSMASLHSVQSSVSVTEELDNGTGSNTRTVAKAAGPESGILKPDMKEEDQTVEAFEGHTLLANSESISKRMGDEVSQKQLVVEKSNEDAPEEPYGVLRLVDLAGSERNYETVQMTAQQHRESAEINSALLALKNCFRAHALGERTPFRSSRLTQVLRACFTEPTHKTLAVATVSPAPTDLTHTLNTLTHVSYMAAPLAALATAVTIDLPLRVAQLNKPINRWSHEEVVAWLASVQGGRFSQVALPAGLDGRGLMQLSNIRLSQLFQGTLRQARVAGEGAAWTETTEAEVAEGGDSAQTNIGRAIFAALREESKRIAQLEGQRRWHKSSRRDTSAPVSPEEEDFDGDDDPDPIEEPGIGPSPSSSSTASGSQPRAQTQEEGNEEASGGAAEEAPQRRDGGMAQRVRTVGGEQVIWWLDNESPEGAAEAAEEARGLLQGQLNRE